MGNKILDRESNCIGWFPNLQKAVLIYFWGTKLRHLKPLVAFVACFILVSAGAKHNEAFLCRKNNGTCHFHGTLGPTFLPPKRHEK